MDKPFLLAQLSDFHVGATWGDRDPIAGLSAVLASILKLRPVVDAVLISGDLTDHASDAEYEQVRGLLADLEAPVYVLAGNHDDREALRRHFDLAGDSGTPLQYAVDLGPVRLVVLDTTRPGHDGGELDAERLGWLDRELGAGPYKPALIALHHPPIATGMPAFDAIGLPVPDRRALAEVVQRHPHVRGLVAGHAHRTIVGALAGRPVLAAPSTHMQARLSIGGERLEFVSETAGFALHTLLDGELSSHVQPVAIAPAPRPVVAWEGPRGYTVSTDPERLDLGFIHSFLEHAYWSRGVPREVVERSIANSLPFGLYDPSGQQAGFARAVTDYEKYAYIGDLFVDTEHRGQALGKFLVSCLLAHPHLQGLARWALTTADAHGLYEQFGFGPPAKPANHLFIERSAQELWPR